MKSAKANFDARMGAGTGRRDTCVQPLPVGVSACGLVMPHREVERVGCDERSGVNRAMVPS